MVEELKMGNAARFSWVQFFPGLLEGMLCHYRIN